MAKPALTQNDYARLKVEKQAVVAVTLDDSGRVMKTAIFQTSGDPSLDAAAIAAAQSSTYRPGTEKCHPTGGTFAVTFLFEPTFSTPANCTERFRDARVIHAYTPDYPRGLYPPHWVTATVQVTIGTSGQPLKAHIANSSRWMTFDELAIDAAMRSAYAPKIVNCQPVLGEYFFKVTFGIRH